MKRRKTLCERSSPAASGETTNKPQCKEIPDSSHDLKQQKPTATTAKISLTLTLAAAIYLVSLTRSPLPGVWAQHQQQSASTNNQLNANNNIRHHLSAPTSFGSYARDFQPVRVSYQQQQQQQQHDQYNQDDGATRFSAPSGSSEVDSGEPRRGDYSPAESDSGDTDSVSPPAAPSSSPSLGAESGEEESSGEEPSSATTVDNSQEAAENSHNPYMERHHSQLQAMQDLFERRQLAPHQHQHHQQQVPASQELNPISIGLDAHPFGMSPFGHDGPQAPKVMNGADGGPMDGGLAPGPLPFVGMNPLPHMLGFPGAAPFEGPQRGDQSAHSNVHSSMAQGSETDQTSVGGAGGQRVWPKIFKFTDGRINLSDFEKQKKIRLSNKHNSENHIESPPIMFDNRPLKRKSFLILHGGIFSR